MAEIDTSKFVEIPSAKAEEGFFDMQTCSCSGHPWSLKERNVVLQKNGREYFVRNVFCDICGNSEQFYFNAPSGSYNVTSDQDHPRETHYLFAHRGIPGAFFEDPEGFIAVLKLEHALARLMGLWKHYDNAVVKDGGESVSSSGLQIELVKVDSWEGVVITMPEAKVTAEACFIGCLITGNPVIGRCFVYENTFTVNGHKRAVLCEWMPGKRRRNFQREGDVNKTTFIRFMKEQLGSEDQRMRAGATSVAVATWDMVEQDDPSFLFINNEPFRHHICFFAFHALPDLCLSLKEYLLDFALVMEEVETMYNEIGEIIAGLGYPKISSDGLTCKIVRNNSDNILLVSFPSPLSPPEPYYMALKVTEPQFGYFLEKSKNNEQAAFFTAIVNGSHKIIGEVDEVSEMALLEAINGRFKKVNGLHLIPHVTSYAQISSKFRNDRDDKG